MSMIQDILLIFLLDPLLVNFSAATFSGSESSGNVSVDLVLKGDWFIIDGNISVIVMPSDQSPLSAEGKRCVF